MASGQDVGTYVKESSAKMGELVQVRRVVRLDGTVGKYVHFNGKIGVLVAIAGADNDEARQLGNVLAEHVAAAAPLGLDKDTVPSDVVERERAIFTEQVRQSGKPEAMIEKIVTGKVDAYYKDVALLHQMWVREPKTPISAVVADASKRAGAPLSVTKFVRFQLGQE